MKICFFKKSAFILLIIFIITSFSNYAEEVKRYNVTDNCTIAIPASWEVSSNYNSSLDELGRSAVQHARDKGVKLGNDFSKEMVFSATRKNPDPSNLLFSIAVFDDPKLSQSFLSSLSDIQKIRVETAVKNSLIRGTDNFVQCEVVISRWGRLYNILFAGFDTEKVFTYVVRVPINGRSISISLYCDIKYAKYYRDVLGDIVSSISFN